MPPLLSGPAVRGSLMMGAFYYCLTDNNGVQCVDRLSDLEPITEHEVAILAAQYPDVIYFHHWAGDPGARV
jgi:hypothetical protein